MNRFFIAIVFAACGAAATAQTAKSPEDQAADTEHASINAERSRSEAAYLLEQKACYQKFAVNDCLRDAGARQRKTLADLRLREIAVNDAQRKRQAAEQAARRQQKAADEQQRQVEQQTDVQRAQQPAKELQRRQERAASGPSSRAKATANESKSIQDTQSRKQRHQDETAGLARKAAAGAAQRAQHDEKIKAANERKADRDRRRNEDQKPPVNPLPMPP